MSAGVDIEIERHELEPNEFAVLQLFSDRDEWSATQLMEHLSVDPSRMSRLVANLVDRRLLRRRRARTDRRIVLLTLTAQGVKLVEDLRNRVLSYETMLLEGVSSEEMAGFIAATQKIMSNRVQFEQSDSS